MMKSKASDFLFIVFLLFYGCANQVAPTGGPKDEAPPKIVEQIPENYSTRFQSSEVEFTFDELIQLKEVQTQMIVSPPLKHTPDIRVKSKKIFIKLQDTLLTGTTYTFNFGNSIQDLNEGNPLDDFTYVFSTGDIVDTLAFSGQVFNAYTQVPEKDVKIMLYRSDVDSLPYLQPPLYFGKTNDKGFFIVKNMMDEEYKLFALKETNNNYLFDSPDEKIAFMKRKVSAGESNVKLQLFSEELPPKIIKAACEQPGKILVVLNKPVESCTVRFTSDTSVLKIGRMAFTLDYDSLVIWYKNILHDSVNMILTYDGIPDTVNIDLIKADEKYLKRNKFALNIERSNNQEGLMDLNKPLIIQFNHPVQTGIFGNVSLFEDSTKVKPDSIYFSDKFSKTLVVENKWKEMKKYQFLIPKGTMTDIFGLENDTLKVDLTTNKQEYYGSLAVRLALEDKQPQKLLQLINEKDNVVSDIACNADTVVSLNYLAPGSYRLRLVFDKNRNNLFDTGNYLQKLQPEQVKYYPESIMIRSNWDIEINWSVYFSEEE